MGATVSNGSAGVILHRNALAAGFGHKQPVDSKPQLANSPACARVHQCGEHLRALPYVGDN